MKRFLFILAIFGTGVLLRAQYGVEWTSPDLGSYGFGGAYGYDVDSDGLVEFEVRGNAFFTFYNGNYSTAWTISFPGYPYVYAVHPRDTDGNGLVVPLNTDADAAGELIITGYYLSGSTYYGRLRVYDANSHALEWESPLITGFAGTASEEDIDGDGRCEIIITRFLSTESYVDVYNCTSDINESGVKYERTSSLRVIPNPSSGEVAVPFTITRDQDGLGLSVAIHDVSGRRIRLLMESASAVPGDYRLEWNGKDGDGRSAAAGSYFVQIRIGTNVSSRELTLIR